MRQPRSEVQRHLHTDHLGTVRAVSNAAGQRVAYHLYYPYGQELTAFNQDTERVKFTGHERDLANLAGAGDDLDYMHARHYSLITGRFLSVDPALESIDPFQPQSWNRYNYVRGNPIAYVDPTGEVLVFSGSKQSLERLKKLINSSLNGYQLEIDKHGVAKLVSVTGHGSSSAEQRVLASALATAIGRPETIRMGVVEGDQNVKAGQYVSGLVDVDDVGKFGSGSGVSSASVLALEIVEQTARQVFSLSPDEAGHTLAHSLGQAAQEAASGFLRGPTNFQNFNFAAWTGTAVTIHSNGSRSVTVTLQWANGNLVKIVRR